MLQAPSRVTVAIARISAWFDSVSIITCPSKNPYMLEVLDSSGQEREVCFLPDDRHVDGLYLRCSDVNGRDIQLAVFAFKILARQLGYGDVKNPVDRGEEPTRTLRYTDDFELVAFRHRDFRRSPNPDPQRLQRYMPVIERMCRKFFYLNDYFCKTNQLELGDLRTYALTWTVNYIANWQLDCMHHDVDENTKKLTAYLKQQFRELIHLVHLKNRNVNVDRDTAVLVHTGKTAEYHRAGSTARNGATEEPEFETYREDVGEDEVYRAASASSALNWKLAALGHDRMVLVLRGVVEDKEQEAEVRAVAKKRLRAHEKGCAACSAKVQEHPRGVDAAG